MAINSLPKQEPTQDGHQANDVDGNGPSLVTDCGAPTRVLPSRVEDQLTPVKKGNIANLLTMSTASDVEFEAPRANIILRPPDFT